MFYKIEPEILDGAKPVAQDPVGVGNNNWQRGRKSPNIK